jgi:predicted alpha/beta-hydrolase family hydrolase
MEQPLHPLLSGLPGVSAVEQATLPAGATRVRAEAHRPDGEAVAPFFFLTHGAGGDRNTSGLKALAEALAAGGHLVVRADLGYRAAGRSTPPAAEKSVPGFTESFLDARRLFGAEVPWVAGGRSYGGRVASMAVAEGLDAAGLLLYSYPLHRPGDPSQPRVAHWPQIKVPALFLEGTNDPFCDLNLMNALLPQLGSPATVHVVPGGDHSLKVAGARAPDGKARSEGSVVKDLAPVIEEWARRLAQAP